MKKGYQYRCAFGAWLNDTRLTALPNEIWPYAGLDGETEQGLLACMDLQQKAGFNLFCTFGLFATYSWKLDVAQTVDKERMDKVNRIIGEGKKRGIGIMLGVGVYSWGFDEIIASDPTIQGTNPHAMCLSSENSHKWMQKVLDFVLDNFKFAGYHLESSDQGRCNCENCKKYSDPEYYSIANKKCAEYIRQKQPEAVIMVNMCGYIPWGDRITKDSDCDALIDLGEHIDYLVDPGHGCGRFFEGDMKLRLQTNMKAKLGSSGGFWVYTPQKFEKTRWFIIYARRNADFLKRMYAEGESAVEFYMGPVNNPGVEFNIMCGGKILSDIARPIEGIMYEAVGELYRPLNEEAHKKLVEIFVRAEDAYFDNQHPTLLGAKDIRGELHLDLNLWKTYPGKPVYLDDSRMNSEGRAKYRETLLGILEDIQPLESQVGESEKVKRIALCIESVIKDLDEIPKEGVVLFRD